MSGNGCCPSRWYSYKCVLKKLLVHNEQEIKQTMGIRFRKLSESVVSINLKSHVLRSMNVFVTLSLVN